MRGNPMNQMLAIYPYTRCETTYINNIQSMLETEYSVISYIDARNGAYLAENISVIYLNWLENVLTESDILFLQKMKAQGTRIVWVFHNRLPHDSKQIGKDKGNMVFLMKIADAICILSNRSRNILLDYDSSLTDKINYLPHQDFIGSYGFVKNTYLNTIFEEAEIVFACYGLIRPYKNFEIVIKAFCQFNINKKCKLIIAGTPVDYEYVKKLEKLITDKSVVFIPEYIPSSMMGSYLECSDALILPYNLKSAVNSGAMIMAFSYKRTVITANIPMADDFSPELIYKYSFLDEEDHVNQLIFQMEKAYLDGRNSLRNKGKELYKTVIEKNSKLLVREKLLKIVKNDYFTCIHSCGYNDQLAGIIEEREIWKERCKLAETYERLARSGKSIVKLLLDSNITNIAIYGYGKYGKRLAYELENNGITVQYIIDKNANRINTKYKIYQFKDELPPVDNLIITAPGIDFYEVMEKMNQKSRCQVYILKEMY